MTRLRRDLSHLDSWVLVFLVLGAVVTAGMAAIIFGWF